MELAIRVQILDKAVYISIYGKDRNPSVLSSSYK